MKDILKILDINTKKTKNIKEIVLFYPIPHAFYPLLNNDSIFLKKNSHVNHKTPHFFFLITFAMGNNGIERIYLALISHPLPLSNSSKSSVSFDASETASNLNGDYCINNNYKIFKKRPYDELISLLRGEICPFINTKGLTAFQLRVYERLKTISFGDTITYKGLSRLVNCPSPRAIGNALARNPFPIIFPCHRVIRKDGGLGGFSQGINIKKLLLKIETHN